MLDLTQAQIEACAAAAYELQREEERDLLRRTLVIAKPPEVRDLKDAFYDAISNLSALIVAAEKQAACWNVGSEQYEIWVREASIARKSLESLEDSHLGIL